MYVFKAAVVGAGTMGGEIAQVIASSGLPVVLKDVRQEFVDTGLTKAREVTPGHAILASNTSSLAISEMAGATSRPDRVVGFHFFYPASMMRLIEVIEGEETSDETLRATTTFAQQIRKTPIRCGEGPGFVVNRVLISAVSEVWRAAHEAGLDVTEVDKVIQESGTAPIGPFYLTDLLGLDTVLHVAEHLHESYGDRFFVSPAMQELVQAGDLGQKTGKGFYEHG